MKRLLSLCLLLSAPAFAQDVEPRFFVNANLGAFKNFSGPYTNFQFDYGGKLAVRTTNVQGFANLWIALAFNRTSANPVGNINISNTDLMVQPIFKNVSGSSFYFAPQAGTCLVGIGVNTTAVFSYGALFGWLVPMSEQLSIAPEVNITRFAPYSETYTALKLLLGVNYAF